MKRPLETGDVAKVLKLSTARVVQLENKGVLTATRTASGTRLFDPDDVKQLAKAREAAKKK